MKELIDRFMDLLPQLTQEEAGLIAYGISLTDEEKFAFKFAKRIFDENIDETTQIKEKT